MLEKFIYAKEKSLFETALNNGEVLDEAIVFIEDTKEIWNHGTYFDGSTFDSTNIELSILNISNTIADYATIRSAASTAVLPDVIADMETKTEAAATYLPIGDYITKTEVADSYLVKGDYALKSDVEVEVEAENGVYAVTSDGKLIDYNLADATATGVALVAGEHKFMIAKSDAINDVNNRHLYWTYNRSNLSLTDFKKVDGTNDFGYLPKPDGTFGGSTHLLDDFSIWTNGALSDFNGKANTAIIAAASSYATDMCTVLKTFNQTEQTAGRNADWYVPACGQLALMYLNMTEINAALAKIGGTALSDDYYWSSSEYSTTYAWVVDFSNGFVRDSTFSKSVGCQVRFVQDLTTTTIKKPLKEKVSELESQLGDINSALDYIINGPKLITFTIDSVEYQAEEGMTWLDWVNSEYNTIMLSISDTKITNGSKYISLTTAVNNEFVDKNETIESVNYYLTAAIPE